MIINKPGEGITWGKTRFAVGEQVYATDASEYQGLIGTILEIRSGEDQETENYLPDIYCCFDEPLLATDRKELEDRFSKLYGCPKKLDEIALDMVIMGPDMLLPMKQADEQGENLPVYLIRELWAVNGECGNSIVATTDYDDAKRRFHRMLSKEMQDGMIPDIRDKACFTVEEKKDYYSCWIDGEFCESHYTLYIQEKSAFLCGKTFAAIGSKYRDTQLREEFEDQISQWDEVSDLTDEEYEQLVQQPELPSALKEALDNHSSYWETYWDAICGKAYALIREFRKKLGKENA